ncbi:hypothetical protein E3P99_01409 [Wallemia hederae]|uniref:F-box domain-containing protein n=1 Tax=Wallemia hederae TaxID=1540922 RepID=A0A4T0FQC1_9BASI|nr:hypothetical protein E3P99_01409 [Wallemia hederae]
MLDNLPPEIVLDAILPLLPPRDILAIGRVSKSLHLLISDTLIWKRKLTDSSNYIALRILTQSHHNLDWQHIYRRALSPHLYVWGEATNGRLGIDFRDPRIKRGNCVPQPIRVDVGVDLVQIVAGGWSYHGLGRNGDVVFWGEYNGDMVPFGNVDYRNPGARASRPMRLNLPFKVVDMSAGRAHVLFLSDTGDVYQSICCALPHRITHPCLENDDIYQINAAWTHSAIFMKSGTIMIFWSYDCLHSEEYRLGHGSGPRQLLSEHDGTSINTHTFDYTPDAAILPRISDETITQMANAEDAILALTESGRLYRMGLSGSRGLRGAERAQELRRMFASGEKQWVELSNFSPDNLQKLLPEGATLSHLSHITTSYRQFALYAPAIQHSVVFAGDATRNDAAPELIKVDDVVDVARGDHHSIALTRRGEVRAWGSPKNGKLGVPTIDYTRDSAVTEPLPVPFSDDRRVFVFSIASAGWQNAALVIDLDGDDEEQDGEHKKEGQESNDNCECSLFSKI